MFKTCRYCFMTMNFWFCFRRFIRVAFNSAVIFGVVCLCIYVTVLRGHLKWHSVSLLSTTSTNETPAVFVEKRHGQNVNIGGSQPEKPRDMPNHTSDSFANKTCESKPCSKNVIRILTWTDMYHHITYPIWFGPKREGISNCGTAMPCIYTNNRSLYNISDVVLFHTWELIYRKMPKFRLEHQHWISYSREAPTRAGTTVRSPYAHWFNWTYSYSMKGHIVTPYGICLPNRDKIRNDPTSITDVIRLVYGKSANSTPWLSHHAQNNKYTPTNYADGKTGLIFWAVSHCRTESMRERYVAGLKRHINIDIVGACPRIKCNRACMKRYFQSHKFYLAFENSLCTDYITEKVWSRMSRRIVPIVLGGADYKTYLPPHSYINVKDFSSPKDLATYLYILHRNDTLYNEYFAWKHNYTCHLGIPGKSRLCDICKFINDNLKETNVIPNINAFWSRKSCIPPRQYYRDVAALSYDDAFSKKTIV